MPPPKARSGAKSSKKPCPKYLRVRSYTRGEDVVDIWIMGCNGVAHFSLLHGQMTSKQGEELVNLFYQAGLKISREISPLPGKRI